MVVIQEEIYNGFKGETYLAPVVLTAVLSFYSKLHITVSLCLGQYLFMTNVFLNCPEDSFWILSRFCELGSAHYGVTTLMLTRIASYTYIPGI